MKMISHLFFLLLIYLICSARSCNDNRNDREKEELKRIAVSKDSIRNVFDVATPQSIATYEVTASQKLLDFADYLKIASDTTMNTDFRQQAATMAEKLFVSKNSNIQRLDQQFKNDCPKTVNEFLHKSRNNEMHPVFLPEQIKMKTPFERENDSTFKGRLQFSLKFKDSESASKKAVVETLFIDVYLIKKAKSFGQEQVKVWEVLLGDVR